MAQEPQTVLQATLIQTLRPLGVDFHLLLITATRRLDPPLNEGVRITSQALHSLEQQTRIVWGRFQERLGEFHTGRERLCSEL